MGSESKSTKVFEAANPASLVLLKFRGQEPEYAYGESTCVVCGVAFPYRWAEGKRYEVPTRCVTCHDKAIDAEYEARQARGKRETTEAKRTRGVPAKLADNDVSRFPAIWSTVSRWSPAGGRGLGLIGDPRIYKTRMIFQRLMDLREQEGIGFLALTSFRLQQAIQHQWRDDEMKAKIAAARTAQVLFIDDLGKQKFTDGSEPEFFDIIDERTAEGLPIVFTSNQTGQELKERMSENVSGPFIERLREFCEIHVVKKDNLS